jgi:hypothetical protein
VTPAARSAAGRTERKEWWFVRLASGLILFAYVVTHFIDHSLGIVSIAAHYKGRFSGVRTGVFS